MTPIPYEIPPGTKINLSGESLRGLIRAAMFAQDEMRNLLITGAIGKTLPMMRMMHEHLSNALAAMGLPADTTPPITRRNVSTNNNRLLAAEEMHEALKIMVESATDGHVSKRAMKKAQAALELAELGDLVRRPRERKA